jgi:acyl-CoA thioester hydrolase
MAYEYTYRRIVQFADTDRAGIVHFPRFLCFVEEAEHAFLRSLGLSVHSSEEDGVVGFPRLSARIEYRSSASFEDEIAVHIWLHRKGTKTLTYQFRILQGERLLALGEIVCIACRFAKEGAGGAMDSCELPARFADALEEAPHPPLEFHDKK